MHETTEANQCDGVVVVNEFCIKYLKIEIAIADFLNVEE